MGEALPKIEAKIGLVDSFAESAKWYAAYTMPRHEKIVAKRLAMRSVETYLPLYRTIHNWNGRKAEVDLPLFPGYVFIRMPIQERVQVLEQPGVIHLVGSNGKAIPLPDQEIERLRSSLSFCSAEPYPFMTPGRSVRIKSGPMEGLEGKILRRKGRLRLVVSLELLQRSIVFEIDAASARTVN